MSIYRRGWIWIADLGKGIGSEQQGKRPVLIIQNDVGNKYSSTVIIAAITASERRMNHMPTHVDIKGDEARLGYDSVIMLEQIRTIDKERMKQRIASLSPDTMHQVDIRIGISLATYGGE